jgi:predicted RNase H-like HicB family nuclease
MFGWFKKRVEQRKVEFQMKVPATVRQDERGMYISSCDLLDVHSQGRSEKEALDNLVEALQLFVETCYEQGTLEQVLKAQGLLPGGGDERFSSDEHTLEVPLGLIARQHAAHAH